MRKIAFFTLICALYTCAALGQSDSAAKIFPIKDEVIVYERVISVESADRTELFRRAKLWALEAYKSEKAALQTEDKELGILVYDSYLHTAFELPSRGTASSPEDWQYSHTTKFVFKENKVKVTVTVGKVTPSFTPFLKFAAPDAIRIYGIPKKRADQPKYEEAVFNNYKNANGAFIAMLDSIEKALKTKEDF